jgi:hypothetical protein
MIKFSFKLATFLVLLLSSVAHATLITTDLTEDNYVTIGDLDWTWASPVNAQWITNTIYTPDSIVGLGWDREGWRHATDDELSVFINTRDITDFISYFDASNEAVYKNSFVYWNTDTSIIKVEEVDEEAFINGHIETYLVGDNGGSSWAYETFYVRDVAQVPEPSTIMIFAIALIALSLRKRAIK